MEPNQTAGSITQSVTTGQVPSKDQLLRMYSTMLLSRRFDEACSRLVAEKKPVPHFHSGIGQEALMVASVAPLRRSDNIIYTHRGYGHLLAKGISLREIAHDMFLREGGTNGGYGAVMHVNRPDLGVPGREGVFGTRFAIAAGLAMAAQRRKSDSVTVCFYGEAAGARGQLYEALNMAVLWHLPVVFVAENNGWSVSSRTAWLYPEARMSRVWRGFEIPVAVIDGNDVEAIYSEVSRSLERARQGLGPTVIEGLTYRMDPHIWWDDAAYQPRSEVEEWSARDPIIRVADRLLNDGCGRSELDGLDAEAKTEVAKVMREVESASIPTWSGPRVSEL